MNQLDLFRGNEQVSNIENRGEIVARYKRLRVVGQALSSKLVQRLDKEMLHQGGKKLGILKRGTLIFDSESEAAVLMDYCLFDVRRKGRNTVEQYLIDSPPDPESDEMTCLRAMQKARYSLFVVESVERGLGVIVRDLKSDEILLVVDMGFGSSAEAGLIFASRLLPHDGFTITGGAALPIGVLPTDERNVTTKKLATVMTPGADGQFDPAPLIRECLRLGCSSQIEYQQPEGQLVAPQRRSGRQQLLRSGLSSRNTSSSSESRPAKVGRNAPCPCGSGKKFKQCCLRGG